MTGLTGECASYLFYCMTSIWWLPVLFDGVFSPLYSPLKVLVSLWVKLPPAFLSTLDILAISFFLLCFLWHQFLCIPVTLSGTMPSCLRQHPVISELIWSCGGSAGRTQVPLQDELSAAQHRCWGLAGSAVPLMPRVPRYLHRAATCRTPPKQMLKTLDV